MRGAAGSQTNSWRVLGFLLTRLMRGAAYMAGPASRLTTDFYSRASCEARLVNVNQVVQNSEFLLTRLMRGAAG